MKATDIKYVDSSKESLFRALPERFTVDTKNYAQIVGRYDKVAYGGSFELQISPDRNYFNKEALLELATLATELASYL